MGEIPTVELLKSKITGKVENQKTLLLVLKDHNHKMESLLGNGFRENTLKGYKTTCSHLENYIEKEFSAADIELHRIDHSFIVGYEYYLRSEKLCSDISAAKYIKHLRKIVNLSLAHGWIATNPFRFYKSNAKPKEKTYLTREELLRIEDKKLEISRLQHVRDIFVFCCYTGLSYADVTKLCKDNIIGLINQFIVALMGGLMRIKFILPLPFVQLKNLQHAHSHFAFAGWVSQMLMLLLVVVTFRLCKNNPIPRHQNRILWVNLVCSYGMLFSFVYQGYGVISIVCSTCSILVSYCFAVRFWKDMLEQHLNKYTAKWFYYGIDFLGYFIAWDILLGLYDGFSSTRS